MSEIMENKKVTVNSEIALLPHNQILYDKIVAEINNGERSIFYSEATGLGKSFIFMKLIQEYFNGKKVLYVVPKIAIWHNLTNYKEFSTLDATIEMTTFAAFNKYSSDSEMWKEYDAVFVDECHHMLSDIQGTNVAMLLEDMKSHNKYSFGMTATPYYKGTYVDEVWFDVSCYGYDVFEAIEAGILPKIKLALANIDLDSVPENLKVRFSITGTKPLLNRLLEEHSDIKKWFAYFANKNELEQNVHEMQTLFPDYEILKVYEGIDNEEEIFRRFEDTNNRVILMSVNKLLEGMHLKGVEGVLLYRNVVEFSTYMQMYGRLCSLNAKTSPVFLDVTNAIVSISKVSEFKSSRYLGERKRYTKKDLFDINASDYWTVELTDMIAINNSHSFTKEERDIMKMHYGNMPFDELCQMLPNRSESSIRAFALRNGLASEMNYWTDAEDNILREYYLKEGYKAFSRLPNRTLTSCQRRVRILGLSAERSYWTVEEENILREYYPTEGTDVCEKLPGRSRSSVERKAQKLGIRYQPNPDMNGYWSAEEDAMLKQYYPIEGKSCTVRFPNKTECVVLARAFKLGLKVIGTFWTPEEEKILMDNYPIMKGKVVSLLPGKTLNAVKGKARLLGIAGEAHRSWTSEEDNILTSKYPEMGLSIESLLPGRSRVAINIRASMLGLKSDRVKKR